MAKRLSYQEKKTQAVVDIINEMFIIAGHQVTYENIKDRQDAWYTQWSMTESQFDKWQKWGQKYLKKKFRLSEVYAQREMGFIGLMWGLTHANENLI
jgi:hypothetical protein